MPVGQESSRRGFMKMLAASPLLAQIAAQDVYAKSSAAIGLASRDNVYSRLGVKTVINCRGTWTYLSGSLQFPEVRAAQNEASHFFVNMVELQRAAGRKLAELTGAESGLITSGAAVGEGASPAAPVAGRVSAQNWQTTGANRVEEQIIQVWGGKASGNTNRRAAAEP